MTSMPLPEPVGRQHEVVYLDNSGHFVVLGTAGSGKTVMAIHRAAYLASPATIWGGPTLLVTYNKALVAYLTHLAGALPATLQVRNYHTVARGYLNSVGKMASNDVVQGARRERYVSDAVRAISQKYKPHEFFDRPTKFFLEELDWISGHGLRQKDSYLSAKRQGRSSPLRKEFREILWKIREKYVEIRTAGGFRYDWWDMPNTVRDELLSDNRPRMFRHIVIDEGQDLPPEAIRSLVELVEPGGSITLFADYAQQLYGQRTSYKSAGLSVQKVEEFRENYRNTVGIARLAIAVSEMKQFTDSTDLVVPSSPKAEGVPPTLYRAPDLGTERQIVRERAVELGKTGRVAILAHTWATARHYAVGISGVHELKENASSWADANGVYIGTYYSAKGLEFDAVILPSCNVGSIPEADAVASLGKEEADTREISLLYVGITRARSELLVTYTGTLTDLLPPPSTGLWLTAGEARG